MSGPNTNSTRRNPLVLILVMLQLVTTAALVAVASGAFRSPAPTPEPAPAPDPVTVSVPVAPPEFQVCKFYTIEPLAHLVSPGRTMSIVATARVGNRIKSFPLLVDVIVMAVEISIVKCNGPIYVVSFLADHKQARLYELAKAHNCTLMPFPERADTSGWRANYDIDRTIQFLTNLPEPNPAEDEEEDEPKRQDAPGNDPPGVTDLGSTQSYWRRYRDVPEDEAPAPRLVGPQ